MSNDNVNKEIETLIRGSDLRFSSELALVEFTGEDVLEWLQGQATNDLRTSEQGNPLAFCLCQPTGQMLAVCQFQVLNGRNFVLTDNDAAVLDRAEKMVILEDVQAQKVEITTNSNPVDAIGRLENGVPLRGIDYTEKTLPPELGPAFEAKHVSYNKGCYTGQEVLMRMHSRGHTNKTWVGLLLESPVEGKAKVQMNGEDVGTITSAAMSPEFGAIAGAMLRNEATQDGTVVQVGEVKGRVTQMPIRKN